MGGQERGGRWMASTMLHAEWAKLGGHMHACGMHTWAAGLATTMAFMGWSTACSAAATGANPATHAGGDNGGWQVVELVKECATKCGAHTSRGCCDGVPVHPTVREPGAAMACEHARAKNGAARPTRWRAWCIGQLACATQHGESCGALTCSSPLGGLGRSGAAAIGAQGAAARAGPPRCPNAPPASEAGVEPGTAAMRGALGLGVGLGVVV